MYLIICERFVDCRSGGDDDRDVRIDQFLAKQMPGSKQCEAQAVDDENELRICIGCVMRDRRITFEHWSFACLNCGDGKSNLHKVET